MTHTFDTRKRIAIEVPSAEVGFVLEQRLSHLHPCLVGYRSDWRVELVDDEDDFDEIVATIRHWLRDERLPGTRVHVDGAVHFVPAPMAGIRMAAAGSR